MEDLRPLYPWYRRSHRKLPWRATSDPYRIWTSEVMLQQTRVETVVGYYERFLRRFPNVRALARARLDDVLAAWDGMGYYARARNLHAAAREVVSRCGGRLPRTVEEIAKLPGIGRSTAGAIASIAFGTPAPVLDGNVRRVLARLLDLRSDLARPAVARRLWDLAERLALGAPDAALHTQAMMELGATVCLRDRPRCPGCPIRESCRAFRAGSTGRIPLRAAAKPVPHRRTAVGAIVHRGRVLLRRRPDRGLLGGLWELPGGDVARGATPETVVRREVEAWAGLRVRVGPAIASIPHAFTHFRMTLTIHRCEMRSSARTANSPADGEWVALEALGLRAMPRAHRKALGVLNERTDAGGRRRTRE